MKITNWHKRNTGAADKLSVKSLVVNCCGPEQPWTQNVQIGMLTEEKGKILLTMSQQEARDLLVELNRCVGLAPAPEASATSWTQSDSLAYYAHK